MSLFHKKLWQSLALHQTLTILSKYFKNLLYCIGLYLFCLKCHHLVSENTEHSQHHSQCASAPGNSKEYHVNSHVSSFSTTGRLSFILLDPNLTNQDLRSPQGLYLITGCANRSSVTMVTLVPGRASPHLSHNVWTCSDGGVGQMPIRTCECPITN